MTPKLPSRWRRPVRIGAAVAAVAAVGAVPAYAAFQLDGTTANVPGNLQPAGQPKVVLGGLKGTGFARVPWLAQTEPNPGGGPNQILVEKFANNAFSLQGNSLNFNPAEDASDPSIDFAGKGSSVPWTAWEEGAAGVSQIFASKFNPNPDLANGAWEINGALRPGEANPSLQRGPSLNFHTDKSASEPELAGGTLNPTGDPAPWVVWREDAGVSGIGTQIFVTKGVKDSTPGASQLGSFTWHVQGTDRGTATADPAKIGPTLNVQISPTVDAVHPDIAFTGANSTVPWAVWYEEPNNLPPGTEPAAPNNQRVFAAKFVPDPTLGDRGGRWVPFGNAAGCGFIAGNEDPGACALNKDGSANAENPNVAAGALDPAKPTVPWVVWHESKGANPNQIFVSRLVGTTFQLFNGPNANGSLNNDVNQNADEPDIRFEGNVLHVTWKETVPGGKTHEFERRFTPGAGGQGGHWSAAADLQVDPAQDAGNPSIGSFGGSPFVTWAEGSAISGGDIFGHTLLKHDTATETAQTMAASDITASSATLSGAAAGDPGVFAASFEVTKGTGAPADVNAGDVVHTAPDASRSFSTPLTGLAPNTVVHVRAKLATAFGAITGADQPFVTAGSGAPGAVGLPATVKKVHIVRRHGRVRVSFTLSRSWKVNIAVHRRTRTGRVVLRVSRQLHRGRNTVVLPLHGHGRFVITIKPRAGATVARVIRLP